MPSLNFVVGRGLGPAAEVCTILKRREQAPALRCSPVYRILSNVKKEGRLWNGSPYTTISRRRCRRPTALARTPSCCPILPPRRQGSGCVAQAGAAAFPRQPRPTFQVADWRQYRQIGAAGSFRRVVCNPPYFPPDSGGVSRDPASLIARHEQEDTLDSLCEAAAWLLQSGGSFCLCHRPERLAAVLTALTRHRLEPKRLQPVQKRADTAPWLFLLEARYDGRPGLTWLPPLTLYTADGQPSAAMREIYREITPTESR